MRHTLLLVLTCSLLATACSHRAKPAGYAASLGSIVVGASLAMGATTEDCSQSDRLFCDLDNDVETGFGKVLVGAGLIGLLLVATSSQEPPPVLPPVPPAAPSVAVSSTPAHPIPRTMIRGSVPGGDHQVGIAQGSTGLPDGSMHRSWASYLR